MMHIAIRAAKLSTHKQRVGAAVVKSGRVFSAACNAVRFKKGNFLKKWENSLHAEQAALLAIPMSQRKGCSLYVARVRPDGSIGNAFPCDICKDLIIKSKVKEVFYTTNCGSVFCWRVNGR